MDMVEKVARALCEDTLRRWRTPIAMKAEPWREFIPAARAAIAAMREPTEEMLAAGATADWVGECESRAGLSILPSEAQEWSDEADEYVTVTRPGIWPKMIEAALRTG